MSPLASSHEALLASADVRTWLWTAWETLGPFLTRHQVLTNVIGGIAVALLIARFVMLWIRDYRFQKIFGPDLDWTIYCSDLTLNREVEEKMEGDLKTHFLVRRDDKLEQLKNPSHLPEHFRGTHVACICEARGSAYLAQVLGQCRRKLRLKLVADANKTEKGNPSFISIGARSNERTIQVLGHDGNSFVTVSYFWDMLIDPETYIHKYKYAELDAIPYEKRAPFFCVRHQGLSPGKPLHCPRDNDDYGIIIKIKPDQHSASVWITCAGLGDRGTAGAAYFLAYKWKKLLKNLKVKDGPFLCLIRVPNTDDSATLQWVEQSHDALEDRASQVPEQFFSN